MTGRVVERAAGTAYRSASIPSTGGPALMPPHSQGAERRTDHRAGRTGSRWSLRALVIGGLAGAAWLLTGAAAQTADRDPADEGLPGSSLLGSVVHDQHSIPVVDRVRQAAAQSQDHRTPEGADSVTRFVPDTALQEPGPPRADTVPAAPVRAAAQPVTSPESPVPDVREADRSASDPAGETPGGDRPALLRGHLGAANGVPAFGPGTATEGGSAALLPARVADSTVASHRLPIVAYVEVRRHDAEAPTVSPD